MHEAPAADADRDNLVETCCQACGHHVAMRFLDEEEQPLATVAWPASPAEAQAMKKLPLAFVRCVSCGHVYNAAFRYEEVPYSDRPNLMFNDGTAWSEHLEAVCDLALESLGDAPVVVEIGYGDGQLLQVLSRRRPRGRFVGFDPHPAGEAPAAFETRQELFVPGVHVAELKPDLVISRHVLEHLVNPLGFLQSMAFASSSIGTPTRVFIEVPCIDRALETGRIVDFYYEHNSHFTTNSFCRMLEQTAGSIELVRHSYNREVITGLVKLGMATESAKIAREANEFRKAARRARQHIRRQLEDLAASGQSVAVWGGTGKAAAFLNHYGLDGDRFPLVVDSDPKKAGTFVPGRGQQIRFRDYLLENPPDVILIPMQWRAADIVDEIRQRGIRFDQILIEHEGRLVDFLRYEHPYRVPKPAANECKPVATPPAHAA